VLRKEDVIDEICEAFHGNYYPGDAFLQGSFDGCEPAEEVGAFTGKADWSQLDSAMLDAHYCALSFFSEGAFRFFLPAYLIADLRGELLTADPLFHLCHGFVAASIPMSVGSQTFERGTGGKTLLNPRRYGAMTWSDYARYRLSAFTREEARAIVSYMNYKAERDSAGLDKSRVGAALAEFWLGRTTDAPSREDLLTHLNEEERFTRVLLESKADKEQS
jgi:hypothetical protein